MTKLLFISFWLNIYQLLDQVRSQSKDTTLSHALENFQANIRMLADVMVWEAEQKKKIYNFPCQILMDYEHHSLR